MARSKNKISVALTAIFCVCISLPAYAYFYNGYHWADEDLPVSFWINPTDIPAHISQQDYINALVMAFETWNAVESSYMVFDYGDTTLLENDHFDSQSTVLWNISGSGMQSNELARTIGRTHPSTNELIEVDTEFNGTINWSVTNDQADTEKDLQSVMLHEAGHWLWLLHEEGNPAIMSPSYDGIRRELFADDIFGISHIYYVARITSIEPDTATDSITITWPSHPYRTYRVMWTDDTGNGWQFATGTLSQQTGTGADLIFVDDGITTFGDAAHAPLAPGVQQRFYLIEAVE